MKNKTIIIIAVIFFLLINTVYYWEGKLGLFAIPAFLLLIVIYFGLAIALIGQLYFAAKEKLTNKSRLLTIGLLTTVVVLTFVKPFGLVDFDKLQRGDVLIAKREGAANCMTTLKLKDDFTFRERNVCFGATIVTGNYHLQHDTIFFDNVELGRHENEFYKFAVVSPLETNQDGKHFSLTRYNSWTDTIGHELWITKNELNKLKGKKPNR